MKSREIPGRVFYPASIIGLLCLGFLGGCLFDKGPATAEKIAYRELEKFSKVLQLVESEYVEERGAKELIEGAINGLINSLDPHSAYLNAELFREMKVETSGKFGGVGIEVSVKDGVITVISPIDETPAFRAGIKAGDRIIRIGDQSTKKMNLADAVSHMRGKPGTDLVVTVLRKGTPQPIEYRLKRESIKIRSVRGAELPGQVGYFRIASFAERTAQELAKAIDDQSKKGKLKGLILDLRGNPGGLLDQAVRVVNLFIDEGPIVYTIGRDRSKKEGEFAQKGQLKSTAPLVVLVDGSSASASEIVAGALQDHGRAVIAGQRTFGKGSVQTVVPLDDAGLKLTVARYYTPSGRSIQAKGIDPDVELEGVDAKTLELARQNARSLREADLEGHFENEAGQGETDGEAEPLPSSAATTAKAPGLPKTEETLEQRLKKDYVVVQAQGILRTMDILQRGPKKPEFKWQEDPAAKGSQKK